MFTAVAALAGCASHAPAPAPMLAAQGHNSSVPAGYWRIVSNGQEYFCHTEATTGSLIKQQVCMTRAQLDAAQAAAQQSIQNIQQQSRTCNATFGPGGTPCQQ